VWKYKLSDLYFTAEVTAAVEKLVQEEEKPAA
jgi:hypothetical protein